MEGPSPESLRQSEDIVQVSVVFIMSNRCLLTLVKLLLFHMKTMKTCRLEKMKDPAVTD